MTQKEIEILRQVKQRYPNLIVFSAVYDGNRIVSYNAIDRDTIVLHHQCLMEIQVIDDCDIVNFSADKLDSVLDHLDNCGYTVGILDRFF